MPILNGASRRIADLSFRGRTKHLRHVHLMQAEKEVGRAGTPIICFAWDLRDIDVTTLVYDYRRKVARFF